MGASRRKVIVRNVDFRAARYVAEASVRMGPLEIGNRIGRAAFDIRPGVSLPFFPEDEEYVEITKHDGVSLDFTGKGKMLDRSRILGTSSARWTVECQDWAAEADRINVTADFNVTAGDNDKDIVEQLLAIYWPQITTQAGLRHIVNARRVNMPAIAITQGSASLREALDSIAAQAFNAAWYVDPYKRLHWNDVLNVAPFTLVDDVTLVGSPDFVAEVLADLPAAARWWRLSEPYGGPAEAMGNSGASTIVGTVAQGVRGLLADGTMDAEFDGSTGYLNVPAQNLGLGDVFSLEAMFRLHPSADVSAARHTIFCTTPANGAGAVSIEAGYVAGLGQPRSFNVIIPGVVLAGTADGTIVPGRLYHVVFTKNGATKHIYLNGVDMTLAASNPGTCVDDTGAKQIGSRAATQFFKGTIGEVVTYPGVEMSASRAAAHAAAALRRFVGYAAVNDHRDGTAKAVRVTVIGTGGNDTVTDYPEYARIQRLAGYERGSPSPRIPQLADVTDMNLTTSARRVQRGWQELDKVARRRTVTARTYEHGLYPGQQVDIIDSEAGTGAMPYVSTDDSSLFVSSDAAVLYRGKGRFYVQRVTPVDRGGENWEYEVECGAYLPSFEEAVA